MSGAAQAIEFGQLDDELHSAAKPTPELFRKVIERAGMRLSVLPQSAAVRIDRLIEVGAWADAVFALIELELPAWKVRRLLYDDGKWLCSLSQRPNLPLTVDDPVEASHEALVLAAVRAFVEVRRRSSMASGTPSTVPQVLPKLDQALCCDNFA